MPPPDPSQPKAAEPTAGLLEDALSEARNLVRIEVALARDDVERELQRARRAAIFGAAAAFASCAAAALLLTTISLSIGAPWILELVFGGVALAGGAALAYAGWRALPKKPLAPTRRRAGGDLTQLEERAT